MTLSLAQYVQKYGPDALQVQQQTGIDAASMLAISYNEGGADPNTIAGGLYPGQYAFFGVKGSGGNAGSITIPSREVIGGRSVMQTSTFDAYNSFAAAAQGFIQFLQSNSRYKMALNNANSPGTFIADLGGAGYATDPTWVSKIQSLQRTIAGELQGVSASTIQDSGPVSTVDPSLASGAQLVSAQSSSTTTAASSSTGGGQFTLVPGVSGPGFDWPGIKISTGFLWSAGFFLLAGLLIIVGLIVVFRKQIEQGITTVGKAAAVAA